MELVQSIFENFQADFQQKFRTLEKQVGFLLAAQRPAAPASSSGSDELRKILSSLETRLERMENRIQDMERSAVVSARPTPALAATTSGGLEGLLMKPITLPSPALSALSENHIMVPVIQRQVVIADSVPEEEAEPDEEAVEGAVAEEVGGIEETEDAAEEEEVEEEVEEAEEEAAEEAGQLEEEAEEEEGDAIELEEFIWKGKTYFKTPDHMVYRANDEGDIEDDPFARYDPKTNTLKRI